MTPTRALIEAAEKVFHNGAAMDELDHQVYLDFESAISSAKAAEEGVEKAYVVEVRSPRKYGANWDSPFDSLADAEAYVASTHSLDSMCSIIRIETRRVREKEGL